MKKNFLIFLVIVYVGITKSFAQTDPAYDSIASLNLDYYASKPVDSLLQVIPQSYNYIHLFGNLKNDKIRGLSLRYSSGMTMTIIPLNYVYMNPNDSNRIWNLELFKKETAYYISVIHPDFNSLWGNSN
jgi:hypothetical protein